MSSVAVNIYVQVLLCGYRFSFLLEMLDHRVDVCLIL